VKEAKHFIVTGSNRPIRQLFVLKITSFLFAKVTWKKRTSKHEHSYTKTHTQRQTLWVR